MPIGDTGRSRLIAELEKDFAEVAAQRRLMGIDLFSWNSDPWAKQPDADSVFRCGSLSAAGREAIEPIKFGP